VTSRFRPAIRVFVSSTFSDLKEERNVLQREVFPKLENYCLVRGFQFQAIDLRWGVPGEAGLDHRTMQICFDELRRAQKVSPKPNFLVLLGDRYGWQPLPESITEDEFRQLEEAAMQLDGASREEQKGTSGARVLRDWHRRDDNAEPTEYLLRSRYDSPDGRDYYTETYDAEGKKVRNHNWVQVEAALWKIINHEYPPNDLSSRFSRIPKLNEPLPSIVKFQASATEQEIWRGALAVPDAKDHVVAWYRTINNRKGCVGDKRAEDFFDTDFLEGGTLLSSAADQLKAQLSQKLCADSADRIEAVKVDLRPSEKGEKLDVTTDHLLPMCQDIEGKLRKIIDREIEAYWHPRDESAAGLKADTQKEGEGPSQARKLELERLAHEQFGQSRAPEGRFVGREKELEAIDKHLSDENDRKLLVVYGASGTGKTALLARAAQIAERGGRRVIVRFLGTTPQSSNLRSLLSNLCLALRPAEDVEKAVPAELRELQEEFDKLLASAKTESPIVLFLDALDQLDEADGARQTYWLRTPLPPRVKVVVSCIYDDEEDERPVKLNEPYRALERRKLLDRAIAVESLTVDEAMMAIDLWLAHDGHEAGRKRGLTIEQRGAIAARITPDAATACRRPLYLRVLFEECRLWPSWKTVSVADLGENTAGLLAGLFKRLESDAVHGRILVKSVLGYIVSARRGLSENEMLEVLWADPEYKQRLDEEGRKNKHELPPGATRIPIAIWSRLRHDLDPYLAEHAAPGGAVLNFYHREVGRVVAARFLPDSQQRVLRHGRLAKYFQEDLQPWWREPDASRKLTGGMKRLPNARRASELPWQLLRAADAFDPDRKQSAAWDGPVTLLCDMEFLEVKCGAGLVFELQEDYRDAIAALPEAQESLRKESERQARLDRWTEEIAAYARQWSERRDRLARGEDVGESGSQLPETPAACRMWTEEEIDAECQRITESPTRLDRVRAFAGFIEQECYPLVEFGERAGFVIQHAFNHAPLGPVHEAAAQALPAVEVPLLVRRWFARNQYNPRPALLRTLEGHTNQVLAVSVTPDGRRVVSGSKDQTLRVWDMETGACLRVLQEYTTLVRSLSVTSDGRGAVSAGADDTLRVWDLETGTSLHMLGHTDCVGSVSVTPDGRRAASANPFHPPLGDMSVRVWDLGTRTCLHVLAGHARNVWSVSVTPDGQRVVSGSEDQTLRVWEMKSGQCLRTLEGHAGGVRTVSVTPDGRRAVSGSGDNTLRVWDLESGYCLRTLEGHSDSVESVSVTPDGRRAVSGSEDNTLRVWDLEAGRCLRVLEGHTDWVTSVSVTPDGRLAVSGSGDQTVRVWDLETGVCLPAMNNGHTNRVASVSVTPDGRRAVSGSGDNLRVWDLETGSCLRVLRHQVLSPVCVDVGTASRLQERIDTVESVSIAADSRRAVSARWGDKALRLWDLETGSCLRVLEGHAGRVRSVSVTPDGCRAVSGSGSAISKEDNTLRVWNLETGLCLRVMEGHTREVRSVSVTPDGQRAVSGSYDKTVRVWDLEKGRCQWVMEGHTEIVWSVSVTPDGQRAVSGSYDKTARVWDLETGSCLRTLEGHTNWVWGVGVTPDGRYAVSGSRDRTVRVWDLQTGACLAVLRGPAPITAVALSSGLGRIIVGTNNGELLQFDSHGLTWN